MLRAALLLATLLAAGCLSGPAPETQQVPAAEPPARELHLSECERWVTIVATPAQLASGSVPRGWGPGSSPLANLGLQGWVCGRVSWDRFERGPLHLVLETHDWAAFPAACLGPRTPQQPWVLASAWIDDAELAQELAAVYGMPVRAAEIAAEQAKTGDVDWHGWSWGQPGSPASRIAVPEDPLDDADDLVAEQFFWTHGTSTTALSLAIASTEPAMDRVATGTAAPPLLLSALPAFAAPGWWSPDASADGLFTLYEDLACQQPA